MSCKFDKFRDLMNVYRVAIDSVLDSYVGLNNNIETTPFPGAKIFNSLPSKTIRPTFTYGGVGSRRTPAKVLTQMKKVAKKLESLGYILNTGDAGGADEAFRSSVGNKNVFTAADSNDLLENLAKEIHPRPATLPGGSYTAKLMARNALQVFGKDLNTPIDFLLMYAPLTKEGKVPVHHSDRVYYGKDHPNNTGGTGQAMSLASLKGIPVINMADENWETQLNKVLEDNSKAGTISDDINSLVTQNLLEYFQTYKQEFETEEARDLVQEASAAVNEALDMVKEQLPDVKLDVNLVFVNNIFNKANFPKLPTIKTEEEEKEEFYEDPSDNPLGFLDLRKKEPDMNPHGGSITSRLNFDTTYIENPEVDIPTNYYGTAGSLAMSARNKSTANIYRIRYIEMMKSKQADGNKVLNENLKGYKRSLLQVLLSSDVFTGDKTKYDLRNYEDALRAYENLRLKTMNGGTGITANNLLQAAKTKSPEAQAFLDRYNAYVELKNFDDLVELYSSGTVRVKVGLKNKVVEVDKYLAASVNSLRMNHYVEDDIVAADSAVSEIYKNYIQILQKVDRNGNLRKDDFLSTELNYNVNKIKVNFRLNSPIESIKNTLENSMESYLNKSSTKNEIQEEDFKTFLTLYVNVYRNNHESLNKSHPKLTEVLKKFDSNNTVESLYTTFKRSKVFSGDVNLLQIVTNNILKVDSLSYSENVYDYNIKAVVLKPMSTKISDSSYFALQSIGNSALRANKTIYDIMSNDFKFSVINTLPGTKQKIYRSVNFNLPSGKSLFYIPVDGGNFFKLVEGKLQKIDIIKENYISIPPVSLDSEVVFNSKTKEYQDYIHLVKAFESVVEQPATIDNYKLLEIMKSNDEELHLPNLVKILGNTLFLMDLNVRSINGVVKNKKASEIESSIKKALAGESYGLNQVWDSKNKRYRIDLGDKKATSALRSYSKAKGIYDKTATRAVTRNSEGKMLPTYGITNAINNFHYKLEKARENRVNSVLADNLFVKYPAVYLGTEIRSTTKSKKGETVHPSKLNVTELLKISIVNEFLYAKLKGIPYRFQPTNFADKVRHSSVLIDPTVRVFGSKTWGETGVENFRKEYIDSQLSYYKEVESKLLEDYKKVFDSGTVFTRFYNNTKIIKEVQSLEDIVYSGLVDNVNQLPIEFQGETAKQEIATLKAISGLMNKKNLTLNQVNSVIKMLSDKVLGDAFNDSGVKWYNHLHFEAVKGSPQINSTLTYFLDVFSNKNREEYIKTTEREFGEDLIKEGFTLDLYGDDLEINKILGAASNKYENLNDFKSERTQRYQVFNNEGDLNPLLKDYLWQTLLVSRNFQLLNVGSPLGHPAKVRKLSGVLAESSDKSLMDRYLLSQRVIAQNKRMVIHQATYHPYIQNLQHGVPFLQNRLYIKDPSFAVFNPQGQRDKVDITDGASIGTPLDTILMNNSLIDQKVNWTHKSIGGELDYSIGAAGLTKHAYHTIINSELRNSDLYMEIFERMLSKDFNNVGGLSVKLDITKDFNGQDIDVNERRDNYFAFYNNHPINQLGMQFTHRELMKVVSIAKVPNGDYIVTYDTASHGELKVMTPINDLFTLWQVLGGQYSVEKKKEEEPFDQKDIIPGYQYSNDSWFTLSDYVNNVGYWNTTSNIEGVPTAASVSVNNKPSDLIKAYSSKVGFNVPEVEDISNAPYDQRSIVQPLKLNNVSQITFNSGQKVGVQNGITLDDLRKGDINKMNIAVSDTSQTGIQLNSDHDTDESIVTEPTQIMSTMPFHGDTPTRAIEVSKAIVGYIDANVSKIIDVALKDYLDPEGSDFKIIKDLVRKEILKAFKDKDLSGLASSIVQIIRKEKESGIPFSFEIPVSENSMYSMLQTSLSNFFTKNGIRRKLPGMAAVAKPYATFIKFRDVPGKGVMTEEKYREFKEKNPDFQETVEVGVNDLDVYDTIQIKDKKYVLNDPETYLEVKQLISLNGGSATKHLTAERDLKTSYSTWNIEGIKGKFTFFDNHVAAIQSKIIGVSKTLEEYVSFLKNEKYNFSIYENQQFEAKGFSKSPKDRIIFAKDKLITRIASLNHVIEMSGVDQGIIPFFSFEGIMKDVDGFIDEPLEKKQFDYLTNFQKIIVNKMANEKLSPVPLFVDEYLKLGESITNEGVSAKTSFETFIADKKLQVNENTLSDKTLFKEWVKSGVTLKVGNITKGLAEIAMATPHRLAFGLSQDMDVSDVDEKFFKNKYIKYTTPNTRNSDFSIIETNGRHMYFVVKGSRNYKKLKEEVKTYNKTGSSKVLEVVKLPVIDENGTLYGVDSLGQKAFHTPYDTVYKVTEGDNKLDFFFVESEEEVAKLFALTSSETLQSKYEQIFITLNADFKLIPMYLRLKDMGLNLGLNETVINELRDIELDIIKRNEQVKNNKLKDKIQEVKEDLVKLSNTVRAIYNQEWVDDYRKDIMEDDNKEDSEIKLRTLDDYELLLSDPASDPKTLIQTAESLDKSSTSSKSIIEYFKRFESDSNPDNAIIKRLNVVNQGIFEEIKKAAKANARRQYTAFQKSLEVIGARIPGQDFQSYLGMKIVHFLNGLDNATYVPPQHQWITGEDFDIDKVYIMMMSLDKNNLIAKWSNFWNDNNPKALEKSLELPIPSLTAANISYVKGAGNLPISEDIIKVLSTTSDYPKLAKNGVLLPKLVDLLVATAETDTILVGDQYVDGEGNVINLSEEQVFGLVSFITWYHTKSLPKTSSSEGYLNGLVYNVIRSAQDVRNTISHANPMSFGQLTDIAAQSAKGIETAKTTTENPVHIYKAQYANMIGKDAIGIAAASGLKTYSVIARAMIEALDNGKKFPVSTTVKRLIDIPVWDEDTKTFITKQNLPLIGISLTGREEGLVKWVGRPLNTFKSIIDENIIYRDPVSGQHSAYLAAATDNAKELILDKLNANPNTLGLFLAAVNLGIDTVTTAKLMSSPEMEVILKLMKGDITRDFANRFDQSLAYLENKVLPARNFMSFNVASTLADYVDEKVKIDGKKVYDILVDKADVEDKEEYRRKVEHQPFFLLEQMMIHFDEETLDKVFEQMPSEDVLRVQNDKYEEVSTPNRQLSPEEAEMMMQGGFEDYNDYQEDPTEFNEQDPFEDMFGDGEGTVIETKAPPRTVFARYSDYNKDVFINNVDPKVLEYIKFLNVINKDITLTAKLASVNQGIKNSYLALYNFIDSIGNYVKEQFNDVVFLDPELTNIQLTTMLFRDEQFRNIIIDSYVRDGSYYNVISALHLSPHIWSMLNSALGTFQTWDKTSAKTRLMNDVLTHSLVKVNTKNFPILYKFVEDAFLATVMKNMNSKYTNITLLKGDILETEPKGLSVNTPIDLSLSKDRETFIDWIENELIRDLKRGVVKNAKGEEYVNNVVKENSFVKRLIKDQQKDLDKQSVYLYYKLGVDMVNASSNDTQIQVDELKTSFAELKEISYMDRPITDYFFLYNLLVNKGKSGPNSFNPLIDAISDEFVTDSIMSSYMRTIGEMDRDPNFRISLDSFTKKIDGVDIALVDLYLRGFAKESIMNPVKYRLGPTTDYDKLDPVLKWKTKNNDEEWVEEIYYLSKEKEKYIKLPAIYSNKHLNVDSNLSDRPMQVTTMIKLKSDMLNNFLRRNIDSIIEKEC